MFKSLLKAALLPGAAVAVISCSPANNKPLSVRFSADSTALVFSGIDKNGLIKICSEGLADTAYRSWLSVFELPGGRESEGETQALPGKIRLSDQGLIFTPLQPFIRGNSYRVEVFLNAAFATRANLLRGKLGNRVMPAEFELRR